MSQGLSSQLDVSPEHSQGGFCHYRVEAHVHQLGESAGRGWPLLRPGLPELARVQNPRPLLCPQDGLIIEGAHF